MFNLRKQLLRLLSLSLAIVGPTQLALAASVSASSMNSIGMLLQLDDLSPEWRPSLPSHWINDNLSKLNDYMSNTLSHKQLSFALKNTRDLSQSQTKDDNDFNMYGEAKPKKDKRIEMATYTDFLAKSKLKTQFDSNNLEAFTDSTPGLWLSFASHTARPQPAVKWNKIKKSNLSRAKSSLANNTLQSLGISSQIQSQMAYNNLLSLLMERMPQGESGRSKLEKQDFQADFRMREDSWRNAMQNAPGQLLARETLFVLAEIRQELHEARKDNERLLATMSMMQAQMTETNMQTMDVMVNKINKSYKK